MRSGSQGEWSRKTPQYPKNKFPRPNWGEGFFLGSMNLTFDQWVQVATAAGGWLAAAGTITAASVALVLARRGEKVRLKASAIRAVSFEGMGGNVTDCFLLSATNIGQRPVAIKGWAWCIGKGKRQRSLWSKRRLQPSTIAYGDTATVDINLQAHDSWRQIAEGLVKHCRVNSLKKLRVEIYPTVGSAVRVVPDQNVLDFLGPFFEDAKRTMRRGDR